MNCTGSGGQPTSGLALEEGVHGVRQHGDGVQGRGDLRAGVRPKAPPALQNDQAVGGVQVPQEGAWVKLPVTIPEDQL